MPERSSGSLAGVRVMLTRPAGTRDRIAELLTAHGAIVTSVPLIRIAPPPDQASLQAAAESADIANWIVFTSANGVAAFAKARRALLPATTRIAVIGRATARAVETRLHHQVDLVPSSSVAGSLADAIVKAAMPSASIAIFQAAQALPLLATRLRRAGFGVTAVVAYSTVETPPPDLAHRVSDADAIVLTSASGGRALKRGLGNTIGLSGKLIVCIGEITANQARRLGIPVSAIAESATAEGVRDALLRALSV